MTRAQLLPKSPTTDFFPATFRLQWRNAGYPASIRPQRYYTFCANYVT